MTPLVKPAVFVPWAPIKLCPSDTSAPNTSGVPGARLPATMVFFKAPSPLRSS